MNIYVILTVQVDLAIGKSCYCLPKNDIRLVTHWNHKTVYSIGLCDKQISGIIAKGVLIRGNSDRIHVLVRVFYDI